MGGDMPARGGGLCSYPSVRPPEGECVCVCVCKLYVLLVWLYTCA